MNTTTGIPWVALCLTAAWAAACTGNSYHHRPELPLSPEQRMERGYSGSELAPYSNFILLVPVEGKRVDGPPLFRPLGTDDPRRKEMEDLFRRPYQRWVLFIAAEARKMALDRCTVDDKVCHLKYDHPGYFVLIPGGNRPKVGLAIEGPDGKVVERPDTYYVEIGPRGAETLLPHEYAHVMMFESLPGDLPEHPKSLPHTTAAITDDVTAFSEGFAIHFETLTADRRENAQTYRKLHRNTFCTKGDMACSDSFTFAKDLMSYSQSYTRYGCVKNNCFAYLPRTLEKLVAGAKPSSQDLLARWTDSSFDPARVRSLEQMVASEGVIATLFYRLATAPQPDGPLVLTSPGDPRLPASRHYRAFFAAMHQVTEKRAEKTPAVLVFLEHLIANSKPHERMRIARIALDVLHFTPVLDQAPKMYAKLHAMGHQVDIKGFKATFKQLAGPLSKAVHDLSSDPGLLKNAAAPEIWLENASATFDLSVFGMAKVPLRFDLNTTCIEWLMSIEGIDYGLAKTIIDLRNRSGGFRSVEDLHNVKGMSKETIDLMARMKMTKSGGGSPSRVTPPDRP